MITIGRYTEQTVTRKLMHIVCEDPEMQRHASEPWFRAYLQRYLGKTSQNSTNAEQIAFLEDQTLARHCFVCGSTGSGKSRLIEHLVMEQIRLGYSAVVLDPKAETVEDLLGHCEQNGVPPNRITVIDPRLRSAVPGWNPLCCGLPVAQSAADFVAVLKQSTSSWGPRMQDLLTNALLVIGAHKLSLFELVRMLTRDDYRDAILIRSQPSEPSAAYDEARTFFLREFGAWSKSERSQAIAPVLNKLRELLRSEFLRPFLCSRRNTVHLDRLWREQHIILVHLDRTGLGDEGAKLLGGLLANLLYRTALRASGPVPVALVVDELATIEEFVGSTLVDIITVARSKNLRLLAACQHLAQLTDGLRSALLSGPAARVYFRLGQTDAHLAATSLAAGTEASVSRVVVTPEKRDAETGDFPATQWSHFIRDSKGNRVRLNVQGWALFLARRGYPPSEVRALRRLAAAQSIGRLYVHSADDFQPVEIGRYTARLTLSESFVNGPSPLQLTIRFPKPKVSGIERATEADAVRKWTHTLQNMAVQHAALFVAGKDPGVIRVVNVDLPRRGLPTQAFLREVSTANGQSPDECLSTLAWRERQVELVAAGTTDRGGVGKDDEGGIDDGSIA